MVWKKLSNGKYQLEDSIVNHRVLKGVETVRLNVQENCKFKLSKTRDPNQIEDEYILIGRGWVD